MKDFDIDSTLKQAAIAYYRNDQILGSYLLKGCLRRISMLPLSETQQKYLNNTVTKLNGMSERCDYTALADTVHFELMQNFPDFSSLLQPTT